MTLTIDELLNQAEVIEVKISQLKPAKYNPRKKLKPDDAEYQHIKTSILTYGIVEEIIINDDFTVINGHQRLQIYKDLGLKTIPCKMLHLDKKMEKAANLMFNKAKGEFDYDKVATVLNDLMVENMDLDITGFSDEEVEALLASMNVSENPGDGDDKEGKGEKDEKSEKLKTLYLVVGKEKIPISAEERDWFISLIKKYIEAYDSSVGFVTWLSANVNSSL